MRVFKPEYQDSDGKACSTPRWHVEFRDHCGRVRRVAGFEDKAATQELGTRLVRLATLKGNGTAPDRELVGWVEGLPPRLLAALRRLGLVTAILDPRRYRPLLDPRSKEDLLSNFAEALRMRERTPKHIRLVTGRARRLFDACGFRNLADLQADRVERQLHALRAAGTAASTSNHILASAREFIAWAVASGLLAADPLATLERVNARVDQRRIRRALTFDELRLLVQAAHVGPEYLGMSGATRAVVWRLAAECGLRVGEIQGLQVRDLDLDPAGPMLTVRAAVSKNRREARQPLRPDLARDLEPYCTGKLPTRPMLPLRSDFKDKATLWLRFDLERAGLAYKDASGRVADVHSLRSSYVSALVRGGVNARVVQTLARHSTPSMTLGIYARLRPDDERAALDVLPSLTPTGGAQPLSATGTDGTSSGADSSGGHLASPLASDASEQCSAMPAASATGSTHGIESGHGAQGSQTRAFSIPAASTCSAHRNCRSCRQFRRVAETVLRAVQHRVAESCYALGVWVPPACRVAVDESARGSRGRWSGGGGSITTPRRRGSWRLFTPVSLREGGATTRERGRSRLPRARFRSVWRSTGRQTSAPSRAHPRFVLEVAAI